MIHLSLVMTHQKQSSILLLPFVGENTVDCSQFFAVGNGGQTAKDSQHFTPGVRITHLVEGLVEVGDSPLFVVYMDERTLATKHGKMLSEASKGSGRPKKAEALQVRANRIWCARLLLADPVSKSHAS